MQYKYIDNDNFDIHDDIFEVDKQLASTISLLNKKGYKTTSCCAGRNDKSIHRTIIKTKDFGKFDLSDLVDYDILIKEDYIILYFKDPFTRIYINFKKDYKFENIPNGFKKCPKWDTKNNVLSKDEFEGIEKFIHLYHNKKRKSKELISKEIEENCMAIYRWACKLPKRNKK